MTAVEAPAPVSDLGDAVPDAADAAPHRARVRAAGFTMIACCMVAVASFNMSKLRDLPEKVTRTYSGGTIHGGNVYTSSPLSSTIDVQPVSGGPVRTVVHEPGSRLRYLGEAPQDPASFVYLATVNAQGAGFALIPGAPRAGPQSFGDFKAGRHGQEHEVLSRPAQASVTMAVRAVNLSSGAAHDIVKEDTPNYAVAGNSFYWIKPAPEERTRHTQQDRSWNIVDGRSELWECSLSTGKRKRLRGGLCSSTDIEAGTNGVLWEEPHEYPDMHVDLYYWRTTDAQPYCFKNWNGDLESSLPVELNGRLYWYACDEGGAFFARVAWMADRLLSANLDGSDQRELVRLSTGKRYIRGWESPRSFVGGAGLAIYKNKLYTELSDSTASPQEGPQLCRVDIGSSPRVVPLHHMPGGSSAFQLDGSYLYFTLTETIRDTWAKIIGDDSTSHISVSLCRFKIAS